MSIKCSRLLVVPQAQVLHLTCVLHGLVNQSLWAYQRCHAQPCAENLTRLSRAGWVLIFGLVRALVHWQNLPPTLRADLLGTLLLVHHDHPEYGACILERWTPRLLRHVLLTFEPPGIFPCIRKAARQLAPADLLACLLAGDLDLGLDRIQVLRALKAIPSQEPAVLELLRRWYSIPGQGQGQTQVEVLVEIFTPQELHALHPPLLAQTVAHMARDLVPHMLHLLRHRIMLIWAVVLDEPIRRQLFSVARLEDLHALAEALAVSWELEVGLLLSDLVPPGPEYHFFRRALTLQRLRQGREHLGAGELEAIRQVTQLSPVVMFVHLVGTGRWEAAASVWDQQPDQCMQLLVQRADYLISVLDIRFPRKHAPTSCYRHPRPLNALAKRLLAHPVARSRGLTYAFHYRCPICFSRQVSDTSLSALIAQLQPQTPDSTTPAMVSTILRLLADGMIHGLHPLYRVLGTLYAHEASIETTLLSISHEHHADYLRLIKAVATKQPAAMLLRQCSPISFLVTDEDMEVLLLLEEAHPQGRMLERWIQHHEQVGLQPKVHALVHLISARGLCGGWLQTLLPQLAGGLREDRNAVIDLARQRGVLNKCMTLCWHLDEQQE